DGNMCGVEVVRRVNVLAKVVQIERKGKCYDLATSRWWKCYSFLWCRLLPIRRYLLAIYRRL
ncbi:MAG: peptidase S41, partial [Bacteroidaceae bacterium]|nr:peptidase S41 [Bacteroidaceae bacterium]